MPDLRSNRLLVLTAACFTVVALFWWFGGGRGEPETAPRVALDDPGRAAEGVPGGSVAREAAPGTAAPGAGGAVAPGSAKGSPAEATARGQPGQRLYVHVAGAVRRPGLYVLVDGSRVAAALDLAGGPARRADLAQVNLAAPLADGQQVIVPLRPRTRARAAAPSAAAPRAAVPPEAPGGDGSPATNPSDASAAGAISLSAATVEELETLDGIGPALAGRIIEYRDSHGGFRSIEELQEVDGIGPKRLEALREAVRP